MADSAEVLIHRLRALEDGFLVVVTGAGISVASGIPTFRGTDPDAVWKKDVTELGTFRYFRQDPVGSWRWYLERFAKVQGAHPNPAHQALVDLERWHAGGEATGHGGRFLLVTQNIDTLHRQAGSERLVEVHGRADRVRCATPGCAHGAPGGSLARDDVSIDRFVAAPSTATLPRCPLCNDILRQHVLWFDEYYGEHRDYGWPHVQEAATSADLVLFVGTSFAVGVTEMFLQQGHQRQVPMLSIDPGASPAPYPSVQVLAAPAEEIHPAVVAAL
jgi:NAD-dependent deacetylase